MHRNSGLKFYVDLGDIRNDDVTVTVTPTAAERTELAKRLNILEITAMTAELTLAKGLNKQLFDITGHIDARVVQACSVTLAPLNEEISEDFFETMTTSPALLTATDDDDLDAPTELIENERIDTGELVSQWLGLALNPFPRSDAPVFEHIEVEEVKGNKPFGVLEVLKEK